MVQGDMSARQAEPSVLGIALHQQGAAVAREWHFPAPLVRSMRALDGGARRHQEGTGQRTRPG
jgi:HD-like signal output (HDOD) protein